MEEGKYIVVTKSKILGTENCMFATFKKGKWNINLTYRDIIKSTLYNK